MASKLLSLVAACALAACGGTSKPATVTLDGKAWTPPAVLVNVPADTPYLIAQLAPMSQEFRDRMFAQADAKIEEAMKLMATLPADFDRSSLPAWIRVAFAWMDELKGKDMKHWSREMGLDANQAFALYGLGVWPVARIGVNDAAKLQGTLERILAKANVATQQKELRGKKYWVFPIQQFSVVMAVLDKEMVASIVPTTALDAALPKVLGLEKPAHSLGETDTLSASLAHYKLLPQAVFLVDVRGLAARFTKADAANPLEAPLSAATGPVTQACRDDIGRFVDVVPRVFGGYHRLDAKLMDFSLVAEMPPALVKRLGRLSVPVPGVNPGLNGHPVFAFGWAMKSDELISLAKEVVKSVRDRPMRCDWFDGLNEAAENLGPKLSEPWIEQFKGNDGGTMVLEDWETERRYGEGSVTMVGSAAAQQAEMALKLVPGFGNLQLSTVGPPTEIPIGLLGGPPEMTAHILVRPQRAALAVGKGSDKRVNLLVAAPTPTHSPLATMQMNVPRLQALTNEKSTSYGMQLDDLVMQLDLVEDGLEFNFKGTLPSAAAPVLAH
ncbi:MAG TPA: hypothetical protein VGM39_16460 [Kofleriaceae bacterium]|jgi:hypothetical protein